jgi:hypothetical protein
LTHSDDEKTVQGYPRKYGEDENNYGCQLIGSNWFFGVIVSTVTTYFMRPLQRPLIRVLAQCLYSTEVMLPFSQPYLRTATALK